MVITTAATQIDVCFDAYHQQELTQLAEAIIAAGGINATGELVIDRETYAVGLECFHRFEAESLEPWQPPDPD